MRYLTLLFICIATIGRANAQSAKEFWQNRCVFQTDGSGKSAGIQVRFSIPCKWESVGNKGDAIKTLKFETTDDDAIVEMISVETPARPMTAQRMDEIVQQKELTGNKGTKKLWSRHLKIDDHDCLEVATKTTRSLFSVSLDMYTVQYTYVVQSKHMTISFAYTVSDAARGVKGFNEFKGLFFNLASATQFL